MQSQDDKLSKYLVAGLRTTTLVETTWGALRKSIYLFMVGVSHSAGYMEAELRTQLTAIASRSYTCRYELNGLNSPFLGRRESKSTSVI